MNTNISNPDDNTGGPEPRIDETLYRLIKLGDTGKTFNMPFRPSAWKTSVSPDGTGRPKPIEPKYVKDFEDGRIEDGLISLSVEVRGKIVESLKFKHISYEAPLAVSNMVPYGSFMVDRDSNGEIIRIIINEAEAEGMACDADGDRASLIWNDADESDPNPDNWIKARTKALFLKWPFTKRLLVLNYIPGVCVEKFTDLTLKTAWEKHPKNRYGFDLPGLPDRVDWLVDEVTGEHYVPQSEKSAFLKGHRAAETGPLTVMFNTQDAMRCIGLSYRDGLLEIGKSLDTGERYLRIEKQGMKAARKDGIQHVGIGDDENKWQLQPWLAPVLTSRRSITRKGQKLESVRWVFNWSPSQNQFVAIHSAQKAWELKLTKADFKERGEVNITPETRNLVLEDRNVINRVIASGYMRVDAYAHFASAHNIIDCKGRPCEHLHTWPKFPMNANAAHDTEGTLPVISVMLQNKLGQPLALTDTKRDDYDAAEGIPTYMYLLPPVWDSELEMWVHPLTHLAKYFETWSYLNPKTGKQEAVSPYDSVIRNPATGERTGFFATQTDASGRYHTYANDSAKLVDGKWVGKVDLDGNPLWKKGDQIDHFRQYPVKAVRFQQVLTEYCGQYGFAVPWTRQGLKFYATHGEDDLALRTARASMVVDCMRDCDEHEMLKKILKANAKVRLCISGNKQTDRRVRRYALGLPNGVACWGNEFDHIARPGKSMSQRVRAATKQVKFTVAVVMGETLTQAHITPTGVEKQLAECFMRQPLSTELEYIRYCKSHDLEVLEGSEQPTHRHTTISGEARKVWLVPARKTAEIGKLVDDHGMKVVPRPIGQVMAVADRKSIRVVNVDLVIPLYEFSVKGCMRSLLGLDEVPVDKLGTIRIPGSRPGEEQIVQALIVELEFFRTGSASENIPGRYKMFSADGMDGHIALEGMYRVNPKHERRDSDFRYPIQLIKVGRDIMKMFPQFSKTRPSTE